MRAGGLELRDAGRPLDADSVLVVDRDSAERFAELVLAGSRHLPVIGYTPRDEDVIYPTEFLRRLLGVAHVALIQSAATWVLDELLPRGFNVYGGAARLWWPGIDPLKSDKWEHPLWTADSPAARIYRESIAMVLAASI
jgi:hypothetical protein